MPSDTIPPCPVCGGGLLMQTNIVFHKPERDGCWYRNTIEAHAALCALVERGRAKFPVIEYAQLASKLLTAREERDQAIRERDAAREVLATPGKKP